MNSEPRKLNFRVMLSVLSELFDFRNSATLKSYLMS